MKLVGTRNWVLELGPIKSFYIYLGSTLKWSDVSALGKSHPPKTVEWRVSYIPGKQPEFGLENVNGGASTESNVTIDDSLVISNEMVGKFIQVKVIRRVKDASQRLPFVYSLAMKGPVSFNDQEAREVLQIVTKPRFSITVEMDPESVLVLFPDHQSIIEQETTRQPYMEGTLTITKKVDTSISYILDIL